jgi:ABC-type multidrug transport system ATPase subunit
MNTLTIKDLKKTYSNGTQALKGVNLTIPRGMFGLLGPNGAGKSTLMRTVATLQEADEGSIWLDDINVLTQKHEVRQILGFLPQEFDVYPKATCYELLEHLAILKGMKDTKHRREVIAMLLDKTNLSNLKNKKLGGFSGGMKQRFGVAQALLNDPKLLIVDEPTAGLDPEERFRFLNILSELGENIIVILSTHIVADVTELCHRVAIINEGSVIVDSDPIAILNELEGKVWKKVVEKSEVLRLSENFRVISNKMYMGKSMVHVFDENDPGDGFTSVSPDLEDAYFYYIR